VELHRRLAAHLAQAGPDSPTASSSSWARRRADRQVVPGDERLGRRRQIRARAAAAVAEAGLELIAHALRLVGHLLVLGDEKPHAADARRSRAAARGLGAPAVVAGPPNVSRTGTTTTWSTAAVERCVAGSNRRSVSTMSPTNSRRTGSSSAAGKMSTMPPRTAKEPCSSTGSSRAKPASASRSARSCGAISVPDRISIERAAAAPAR
jgi:hypothetical protein